MKKCKAILIATLAVAMVGSLAGCGKSSKAPFDASINRVFTMADQYEGDLLVFDLDITNNTEEYIDGYEAEYGATVTLDGTPLTESYMSSSNPNEIDNSASIGAGQTGKAQIVVEAPDSLDGELKIVITTYSLDAHKDFTVLDEVVDTSTITQVESESDYTVTIDNKQISDDGDGNPILVVDMTFTNGSKEATSFVSALNVDAYQDGIELESGYLSYRHPLYDEDMDDAAYNDIQPGKSIQVRDVYELKNSDSDVEFEVHDQYSFDNKILAGETISLKDTESYVAESDYNFDLDAMVLAYSKYDDSYCVVMIGEFTNNSDENISFSSAVDIDARQAGMEMQSTSVPGAYALNSNEISPGTTITVAKAWMLNDGDANVSITINDSYSYNDMELYSGEYTIDELIESTETFLDADTYTDSAVDEDEIKEL